MRGVLLWLPFLCLVAATTEYKLESIVNEEYGWSAALRLISGDNKYGKDTKDLRLDVYFQTRERLRFTITDPYTARWQVPSFTIADQTKPMGPNRGEDYQVNYTTYPFSLQITRRSDLRVLFDSNVLFGPLTFQNQFLQISTRLGNDSSIFGLGEHVTNLKLPYNTYTLWNRDLPTPENTNLYGSHPFYLQMVDGKAHGVFFHNSNGMDVLYRQESSQDTLTFRAIGGILDFYIFTGGTPEDAVNQYTKLVGKPYMPPYWALGFHQCRYGYRTVETIEQVVENYTIADIPLETIWTDIDYMDNYFDFTYDPERFPPAQMKAFVDSLHAVGRHYMPIVDVGISNTTGYFAYDSGSALDLWTKDGEGNDFIGKVWPGLSVFPDWFHPKSAQWWEDCLKVQHDQVPFDGMWIDMNEISNFCDGVCGNPPKPIANSVDEFDPNFPPYAIQNGENKNDPLYHSVLDMSCRHYGGEREYDTHNLHGYMQTWRSRDAMENIRGQRALIISRSSYSGHGSRGGRWTGDNRSTFRDLEMSIPDVLHLNLLGIPLVGADICGFQEDATEQLCGRWIQVGAFYPFSRNHNSLGQKSQELYRWESVTNISRTVLNIRYRLLPLYYTLFHHARVGISSTVARALFFVFPQDIQALSIDQQFMIGNSLLITPVLTEDTYQVTGYFPPMGRWYDFYTYEEMPYSGNVQLDAPLDFVPLHLLGGSITPTQAPNNILREARKNPFLLIVALNHQGSSTGSLYLDDGGSIDTNSTYIQYRCQSSRTGGSIRSTREKKDYPEKALLGQIDVLGVSTSPSVVQSNNQKLSFTYNETVSVLSIYLTNTLVASDFTIKWK